MQKIIKEIIHIPSHIPILVRWALFLRTAQKENPTNEDVLHDILTESMNHILLWWWRQERLAMLVLQVSPIILSAIILLIKYKFHYCTSQNRDALPIRCQNQTGNWCCGVTSSAGQRARELYTKKRIQRLPPRTAPCGYKVPVKIPYFKTIGHYCVTCLTYSYLPKSIENMGIYGDLTS